MDDVNDMCREAQMDDLVAAVREAAEFGGLIAFGGSGLRRKPMAAAAAIAMAGIGNLNLLAHAGGPEVDLLIGVGLVRRVIFSYVGFEFLGVAPNFRHARERSAIAAEEWSEFGIIAGLRAGAERVPFHPLRGGTGSDLVKTGPLREIKSPFPPHDVCLAVPALRPAVALVHCDAARRDGAAYVSGDPYSDRLLGLASDRLFVTTERWLSADDDRRDALFLPPDVAGVVECPGGSGWTSCPPVCGIDVEGLVRHLEDAPGKAVAHA